MAKETKTITVHPNYVQESMDEHAIFGWEVSGNQEVKTVDSHLETRGDNLYNVTQTEHYIRLTYQRDPASIPKYSELSALDKEYFSVPGPGTPSNLFSKFSLIILGIGVFFIIAALLGGKGAALPILIVLGIAIIGLRIFLHVRKNKQWNLNFDAYKKKREEIVNKAKALQN